MKTSVSLKELKKHISILRGKFEGDMFYPEEEMANESYMYHQAVLDACRVLGHIDPNHVPTWDKVVNKCEGLKGKNLDRLSSLDVQNIFDDICIEYLYENHKSKMYEKLIETNKKIIQKCLLDLEDKFILNDPTYSEGVEIEPKTDEGKKMCLSYIADSGYDKWKEQDGGLYVFKRLIGRLVQISVTKEEVEAIKSND